MKRIVLALIINFIIITSAHAFITFNQELDVSSSTTQIRGINFKPDGTIMYVTERNGTTDNAIGRAANIIQFSLSTPFDISTAQEVSNTRVEEEVGTNLAFLPHAIEFKPDGTRLFLIANTGTLVYQFDLSTPWDTSTISFSAKYNVTSESQLRTITFKPDGTRMYVSGSNNDKLKEYELATPWDITTSNVTVGKTSASLASADNSMRNVQFNSTGTELYIGGNENNNMNKYTLSTAWDISTISSTFTTYTLGGTTHEDMRGFIFVANFTRLYITDDKSDGLNRVIEYTAACATTINCENPLTDDETVAIIEAQVELSKKMIRHNTLPIMHRIEWLRRHKNYDNLNNLQAEISFSDQRLSKLVDAIKSNKKYKKPKSEDDWHQWSEGRINYAKTHEKTGSLIKRFNSKGVAIGADRKKNQDTMYGYVFQFGADNINVGSGRSELHAKSFSVSIYGTKLRENHIFTDGILGFSHLDLDIKRDQYDNLLKGSRDGRQIFGTLNIGKRINNKELNFNPSLRLDFGYTELGSYQEETSLYDGLTDLIFFNKHEVLTALVTAGVLIDKTIKHYEDRIINHNGRLEYILDASPSSDTELYYLNNPTKIYSIKIDNETDHNYRIGYGFDVTSISGWSVIANFERENYNRRGYSNNFYISAGYVPIEGTKFALGIKNNNNMDTAFNIIKEINGFNLKFDLENNFFNSADSYLAKLSIHAEY